MEAFARQIESDFRAHSETQESEAEFTEEQIRGAAGVSLLAPSSDQ